MLASVVLVNNRQIFCRASRRSVCPLCTNGLPRLRRAASSVTDCVLSGFIEIFVLADQQAAARCKTNGCQDARVGNL